MLERTSVQGTFCIWAVSSPRTGRSHAVALWVMTVLYLGLFGQIISSSSCLGYGVPSRPVPPLT